jgi:hypothetical protein
MSEMFDKLRAEFPRDAVSWRAQSMKADGTAAMALAYIDARDVMNRLDDVCGPDGWQDRYEFHGSRTVCYLSITPNGGVDWITKADGAGDTDVEAEKGGISDAFKRAAVKWGIGRYLYDLPAPWVNCESYEKGGKRYWKRWTEDPWAKVRTPPSAPMTGRNAPASSGTKPAHSEAGATLSDADQDTLISATKSAGKLCADPDTLRGWWIAQIPKVKPNLSSDRFEHLKTWVSVFAAGLSQKEAA